MREGEQFLHKKYSELHTSKPVEHEQERRKIAIEHSNTVGNEISHKPAEKIASFLDILERTHMKHQDENNPNYDLRVIERIKKSYHKQYVIKPEEIPESYFDLQKKLARDRGYGDVNLTSEMRKQLTEVIIGDQESTLDNWVDYLSSKDSDAYPMWAKYWAFRSMLKLSTYDKEKRSFSIRDKGTTAPFVDLDREALAYVVDIIVKKAKRENIPAQEDNPEFQKIVQSENFAKLYAYAIEKVTPEKQENLINTKGEWVRYFKGSDPMSLVKTLQGHGTGWCTAVESTAKTQLQGGDFYTYYSYDQNGNPSIPRAAIRMEGDNIGEVRGIAHQQNLDPFIGPIVKEKLSEFPDGKKYEKKEADMNHLTEIDRRQRLGLPLSKQNLAFIYEIESPIEGFGYQRDPRIEEIRNQRKPQEDMLIVFECTSDQIAHNPQEINQNTKAYLGPLSPGIFQLTQNHGIEHIYTKFPESKIQKYNIEIGGKTKDQLEQELENRKDIYFGDWAKDIINKPDFTTSQETKDMKLVRLTVAELGFPDGATTDEIYKRADELGLDLCPAEVGPQLRLQSDIKDWTLIAMKQITGSDGRPGVFDLISVGGQLGLSTDSAASDEHWRADLPWVFSLRKLAA
jgi:hypothetical protein